MNKSTFLLFVLSLLSINLHAQETQYKAVSIGFYNLENLFDMEDDTTIWDEEFTPFGKKNWDEERYNEKQSNMAYVISQMGKDVTPAGVSILGVAEIENRRVLEDLVAQPALKERKYQIIHKDSKDRRGIDVGLIYNPLHFEPEEHQTIPLDYLLDDGDTLLTRDILYVRGKLDGDEVAVFVNHWPSRRGGEARSQPKRNWAAKKVRTFIDSLQTENPKLKALIMGDLNDDPTSPSVVGMLRSVGDKDKVKDNQVFNPMEDFYRRGLGSNAYQDNWSLFDQIILTPGALDENTDGYYYYKAQIFNKNYLIQRKGKYRGYPFRTFSFDKYQSGFSDHFPVLVYMIKKV